MKQNTETKTAHHPMNMWPFAAVFVICAVIQFDALTAIIPNQTAALGPPPCCLGNWGGPYFCKNEKGKHRSSALQQFPAFRQRRADPFLCDHGRYRDGGGQLFVCGPRPCLSGNCLQVIRYIPLEISFTIP